MCINANWFATHELYIFKEILTLNECGAMLKSEKK